MWFMLENSINLSL